MDSIVVRMPHGSYLLFERSNSIKTVTGSVCESCADYGCCVIRMQRHYSNKGYVLNLARSEMGFLDDCTRTHVVKTQEAQSENGQFALKALFEFLLFFSNKTIRFFIPQTLQKLGLLGLFVNYVSTYHSYSGINFFFLNILKNEHVT